MAVSILLCRGNPCAGGHHGKVMIIHIIINIIIDTAIYKGEGGGEGPNYIGEKGPNYNSNNDSNNNMKNARKHHENQ